MSSWLPSLRPALRTYLWAVLPHGGAASWAGRAHPSVLRDARQPTPPRSHRWAVRQHACPSVATFGRETSASGSAGITLGALVWRRAGSTLNPPRPPPLVPAAMRTGAVGWKARLPVASGVGAARAGHDLDLGSAPVFRVQQAPLAGDRMNAGSRGGALVHCESSVFLVASRLSGTYHPNVHF